jgi:hypothetical protein
MKFIAPADARFKWLLATLVGLAVTAALIAAMIVARRPEEPIELTGYLTKSDVADIRVALRHKRQPPIFPDFSIKNLRAAPGLIWERVTTPDPKIYRIEARTPGFVAVFSRLPTNSAAGDYAFWCVFKETNRWWAGDVYYLTEKRSNPPRGLAGNH